MNFHYPSHYTDINGSKIHYIEQGEGDPILFLHGFPTSSYVWRKVIPHLSTLGRCIAPDLLGMGNSDKPDIGYTIDDHVNTIEKFIETLKLKNITLVMHGWGSVIGFTLAMKNPSNYKGLVFYEAYLRSKNGDDLSLPFLEQINFLEKQKNLEDLMMNSSYLVDIVLPQSMMQTLSKEELDQYRKPFLTKNSGKVLYQYWKELPRGDNNPVENLIADYSKKLTQSQLPKLMLYSIPGFITTVATLMWAKEHFPNLQIAEVGEDLHYAQESHATLMGETISAWLQSIEQRLP